MNGPNYNWEESISFYQCFIYFSTYYTSFPIKHIFLIVLNNTLYIVTFVSNKYYCNKLCHVIIVQSTSVCEGGEADFILNAIYLYKTFCNKQFRSRFKEKRNRISSATEKDVLLLFWAVSSLADRCRSCSVTLRQKSSIAAI